MNGYQITFFTQQDRKHDHQPLAQWLMLAARQLGISGATLLSASEGYGQGQRIHSARFFELPDQPQEVVMAVTQEESVRLFDLLKKENVRVFYAKTPVEFGVLGQAD